MALKKENDMANAAWDKGHATVRGAGALVTWFPFGMFCMASRGGGWAGEHHPHVRRERGLMVALRTPDSLRGTEIRVVFPDGTGHWLPLGAAVTFADATHEAR